MEGDRWQEAKSRGREHGWRTDLVVRSDEHAGAQLVTDLACSRAGVSHFPVCVFIGESHLDGDWLDETKQSAPVKLIDALR